MLTLLTSQTALSSNNLCNKLSASISNSSILSLSFRFSAVDNMSNTSTRPSKQIKVPTNTHPVPIGYEPRMNPGSSASNDGSSSSGQPNIDDYDLDDISAKEEERVHHTREDTIPNSNGTSSSSAVTSTGATSVPIPSTTSTIIKYGGAGGLYGDTTIPTTLPAMPKLAGSTAHHYADWRLKATNYFVTSGLSEVVTMEPSDSLKYAIEIDGNTRPTSSIKALWIRLNSKAYGVIRAAVETVMGITYFEDIESDPDGLSMREVVTASMKQLDTDFKNGCAYYLWDSIRRKLEQFTPHDLSRLVERYMNLKYTPRSNPIECRNYFDNSVRELKLAGVILPDKLHLAVWYKALPSELDSLRQALGAKPNLQWRDIYDALMNQYSSKKAARNNEKSTETANAAFDNEKKKESIRTKRDQTKLKNGKSNDKSKKLHCNFCERDNHEVSDCHAYKRAQAHALAAKNSKGKKTSDSEENTPLSEHAAIFLEDEIASMYHSQDTEELAALGQDDNGPVHFIFDSGATTHVTPNKNVLDKIVTTPIITMSTAISGERSVINKRGQVRLNDNWTLRDVAYVSRASSNLISEGRLCDAGYDIYKNKDFVHVRKDGKTVLRGVRANRLWIYTIDGDHSKPAPPRIINTLVPTKPSADADKSDQSEQKNQSSNQPSRTIPKNKGAPKPAATGGAGSSL
jgi:hypothetical protein